MNKQKGINILKDVLLEKITGEKSVELIKEIIKNCDNQKEITKLNSIYRLCRVKSEIDNNKGSWEDFLANLRQIMLYYKIELNLNKKIIKKIKGKYSEFNLFLYKNQQSIKVLYDKYPKWFLNNNTQDLKIINELYDLKKRRTEDKIIGDGILHEMTGFTHYISKHQKAIVQASMDMPEGYTLLGCLPTGGGKSLSSLLPAYFSNEGGTISAIIEGAGVSIVVVPTVALAIDQVNNARIFFDKARSEEHKPQAYHSGLTKEEKKKIFNGLRKGTIPLLFTSPEALMTGTLNEIILDIAKYNKINRLIIDEAHIVGSWGNIFRTEFQMLSILQKKLFELTNGKLRTILLSATITNKTTDLLKELFVIEDKLIEMRGDKLRPE
ncbi:MAG: DEAD/DEAH box helicase, partial [bacterium]